MPLVRTTTQDVTEAVEAAVRDLLHVRVWGQATFVQVPLLYPSGSFVTVKIDLVPTGFRVSDNGFAYREAEMLGAGRSFSATAMKIAAYDELQVGKRSIYADVGAEDLTRAICDVAKATCRVADKVVGKAAQEAASELEDHLQSRLISVFGEPHVKLDSPHIIGASTSDWEVSAIVDIEGRRTVFQVVANHANSVYRTTALFSDLGSLPEPPRLAAFVHSKAELGAKLTLLAQSGSVIEDGQPDSVFVRAAAA